MTTPKPNPAENATPRTDEAVKECHGAYDGFDVQGGSRFVSSQFARTLERETIALTASRDALAKELAELKKLTEGCCHICGAKTRSGYCSAWHEQDTIQNKLQSDITVANARADEAEKGLLEYQRRLHDAQDGIKDLRQQLATATLRADEAEKQANHYKNNYLSEWQENEAALEKAGIDFTVTEEGGKPVIVGIEEIIRQRDENAALVERLRKWIQTPTFGELAAMTHERQIEKRDILALTPTQALQQHYAPLLAQIEYLKEKVEQFKKERQGAMHSNDCWDMEHAKAQEKFQAITVERDTLAADLLARAKQHADCIRERNALREIIRDCREFIEGFMDGATDAPLTSREANRLVREIDEALQ